MQCSRGAVLKTKESYRNSGVVVQDGTWLRGCLDRAVFDAAQTQGRYSLSSEARIADAPSHIAIALLGWGWGWGLEPGLECSHRETLRE